MLSLRLRFSPPPDLDTSAKACQTPHVEPFRQRSVIMSCNFYNPPLILANEIVI